MNANVNLEAALGVLMFLGFGFCLGVAGLIVLHALAVKKDGRARMVLLMMFAGCVLYFCVMTVFSWRSREKALARGEEKYFCEIDCHLAYSLLDVRRTKTLGDANAGGVFYLVNVKTRFDENTISSRRGNQPLTPNPRDVTVIDEQGRRYQISTEGTRALEASKASGTPLSTPLRPGESYTTELVFDLPADVKNARLLINESDLITHFIIGHENSPLHGKTEFRLEPVGEPAERIAGIQSTVKQR